MVVVVVAVEVTIGGAVANIVDVVDVEEEDDDAVALLPAVLVVIPFLLFLPSSAPSADGNSSVVDDVR